MTTLNASQQAVVLDAKQQMIQILRFYMDVRLDARLSRLLDKFKLNMKAVEASSAHTGRRSSIIE